MSYYVTDYSCYCIHSFSLFSNENNGSLLQRSLLSILFFKDISLVSVVPKIKVGILKHVTRNPIDSLGDGHIMSNNML